MPYTCRLKFVLRGHPHPRQGKGLGEREVGAVQSARDGGARCGDAVRAGGILWRDFDETQCRQGVEACGDCDVVGAPAGRQLLAHQRGEHDDERMGAGSGFAAQEDGAPGEGRGCAGPQRLRDRGQSWGAVMHALFVGLRWSQVGLEPGAASAFGGFALRVLLERQG